MALAALGGWDCLLLLVASVEAAGNFGHLGLGLERAVADQEWLAVLEFVYQQNQE